MDNKRVRLSNESLEKLFSTALAGLQSAKDFAKSKNISLRTIRDWRRGIYSIPLSIFNDLLEKSGLPPENFQPEMLPEFWYTKKAGRLGGQARIARYGNFGTPEGRSRGGKHSVLIQNKFPTGFTTLQSINKPNYSEAFAEFMGILFGDGHLARYQALVTTNSKTDMDHARFIKKLIEVLFKVPVSLREKKGENTVNIVASSKNLVAFLYSKGMPIGNKIKNNLQVPTWIYQKIIYQKAFIRGLFDTDGCIYVDRHRIAGKGYVHLGWTITSHADRLIADIVQILKNLGFNPTRRNSQRSVYLRRQKEIGKYFEEISTHNPKHRKRYVEGCIERG